MRNQTHDLGAANTLLYTTLLFDPQNHLLMIIPISYHELEFQNENKPSQLRC